MAVYVCAVLIDAQNHKPQKLNHSVNAMHILMSYRISRRISHWSVFIAQVHTATDIQIFYTLFTLNHRLPPKYLPMMSWKAEKIRKKQTM